MPAILARATGGGGGFAGRGGGVVVLYSSFPTGVLVDAGMRTSAASSTAVTDDARTFEKQ